jgi:hypothetical protein
MSPLAWVPVRWRFEAKLALRHLLTGGGQTLLTVGAVAAGVIVIVFLTALVFGLRARLTRTLTEIDPARHGEGEGSRAGATLAARGLEFAAEQQPD